MELTVMLAAEQLLPGQAVRHVLCSFAVQNMPIADLELRHNDDLGQFYSLRLLSSLRPR
jgi:hypothetical protein